MTRDGCAAGDGRRASAHAGQVRRARRALDFRDAR
ncbi:hypothetical protein BPC006_I3239 [Burkholderia pseudomallei BPC006]|nr:hypothetical protein BPC006_I3239 [Burkholderia pseudomallei BPC006]